jgi:quinol-cytochrome oxidoreductase complex cytochrome b subunit
MYEEVLDYLEQKEGQLSKTIFIIFGVMIASLLFSLYINNEFATVVSAIQDPEGTKPDIVEDPAYILFVICLITELIAGGVWFGITIIIRGIRILERNAHGTPIQWWG